MSAKQLSYLKGSTHGFNVASGAISSGKTFVQILRWYKHIYDCPDGSLLMASGKTAESLYDNVLRDLEKINPNDIKVYRQPQRVKVLSKKIEVACADAHDERSWGKIQGKTVFGWLADEITRHPKNFITMALGRCRGEGKVWPKFWTCNPESPEHYVLKDYIQNENIDIRNWHFVLDDNPILSDEYKDEIKSVYTGVYYDRYILGKWVLAEGMVYEEFDPGANIIEPLVLPDSWMRVRGVDYGYTNPFVCLWGAVDHDGRLFIYDEHYQAKTLIKDHAHVINNRIGQYAWTVADHDAQDNAEMRDQGIYTRNAKKDVILGIQKVKRRLVMQPDGYPRLFISRTCKNLLREFGLYRWADPKEGRNDKEEPIKENDHAMDALRYMVMELDIGSGGMADENVPGF